MKPLHFSENDISVRPQPGWYTATIATACWRHSSKNNRMVYVQVLVDGVGDPYDRISDYFVLEGVSPQGIACSRRRLVALFRAGGRLPKAGEEIQPGLLEGIQLEVRLDHETWKGKLRLEIRDYRGPLGPSSVAAVSPGEEATVWKDGSRAK